MSGALVLSHGRGGGLPAWSGRDEWLRGVEACVLSLDGSMLLRRLHVSARAVYAVALHDARTATARTGRDVATAHDSVARALGFSRSVVERARRWLRLMRLAHVVENGRYLTIAERRQAATGQIRAASTRVLTHPPGRVHARRRHRRDVLPRRGLVTPHGHVPKRSPSRSVDNSPREIRPMWVQRLAGKLAAAMERRGRPIVAYRHIGNLVTGLLNLALPVDVTCDELLTAIDQRARPAPTGPIAEPLAWFLHQARTVVDWILEQRMRPVAPREHRHDFRAIHSPTVRGCLTCPAEITLGDDP